MNENRTLFSRRCCTRGRKFERRPANTILFASLMLIACSSQVGATVDRDHDGWYLEGTWVVAVDPPAPSQAPTHLVFNSFVAGGVMIGSRDRFFPPPIASVETQLGAWERTGGKDFASTFVGVSYDASGQAIGTVKVNNTYRLTDKNAFVGQAQLFFCDLNLNCGAPIPGATLVGTRLLPEPMASP